MKLWIIYLVVFISSTCFSSGTVVGNGGDPVFEFMEAARQSMIETIRLVIADKKENEQFCQGLRLEPEQKVFCRSFFNAVAFDLVKLNQGTSKTLFVLRENPLLVEGPDGEPMMVAARTQLGPEGVVELHRESVKTMIPTQILFLLTHEFLHKVPFEGRYVTDNERVPEFVQGRHLIDAVASALVSVARKKGKIGTQFGVRDIFECQVHVNDSKIGVVISSSRLFNSEDLMSYQTSIGHHPMDGAIYVPETKNTNLQLRMMIVEPKNCGGSTDRRITLEIVRAKKNSNGVKLDEVVSAYELAQNPMCPGSNSKFDIGYKNVHFFCGYFGSQGTTSSPWGLRSH